MRVAVNARRLNGYLIVSLDVWSFGIARVIQMTRRAESALQTIHFD